MKVRCKQDELLPDQVIWLKLNYMVAGYDDYINCSSLTIGQNYLVYAIIIEPEISFVLIDLGDMAWSYEPLILFEVTESTVSRHWHIQIDDDGDITLAPAMYFAYPFLMDHAGEGQPEAVAVMYTMQHLLRSE